MFSVKRLIFILALSSLVSSCNDGLDYTIKADLNPNNIAPLTAMLAIESDKPCRATVKVLGDIPIERSYERENTSLSVPVLGLYPNRVNKVEVTLDYEGGQKKEIIDIQTAALPNYFPDIRIMTLDKERMEPGMHTLDIHFANFGKFRSAPIMFDDRGEVRWFLDLSFHGKMVAPFQILKNGNIIAPGRNDIYEFDMMGKIVHEGTIDEKYGIHHDILELPNGDLLLCVGKRDVYIVKDGKEVLSDSDFIVHYDRKDSKVLKEWDLASHLDVDRDELNFFRNGDWFHMNAIDFDTKDSTIVVSGRNQGLVKISWDDKLKWIMAPKQNWGRSGRKGKGYQLNPYLLTAVDANGKPYEKTIQMGTKSAADFDFPWGPHAPLILSNGNILVFDNGSSRNYNNDNNYSRAVEFKIDDENKTLQQVWEYGKDRGAKLFSRIVSDVDYLPNTNNILMTSGFITPRNIHQARVVEVSQEDNKEVFEAAIFFKNTNKLSKPGWGSRDILYRSERMELKMSLK